MLILRLETSLESDILWVQFHCKYGGIHECIPLLTSIRTRLLSFCYYPRVKFSAMVLCEPMMMAHEFSTRSDLPRGSEKRRDIWPSKQEAYTIMKGRETWKKWEDRVLRIYTVSADALITRY